jgi:hypothetical protein
LGSSISKVDSLDDNIPTTTVSLHSLLGFDIINNEDESLVQQEQQTIHRQLQITEIQEEGISTTNNNNNSTLTNTCASAFVSCEKSVSCNNCIQSQVDTDILFGISSTTKCDTIVTSLQRKKLCTDISNDLDMSIFCSVFSLCTQHNSQAQQQQNQSQSSQQQQQEEKDYEEEIDCSTLTECNWPGFKPNYIGDGVCNEYTANSCYNTPICQYDGGDCCADTCVDSINRTSLTNNTSLFPCGIDGYYCRNVYSNYCNNQLTNGKCKSSINSTSSSTSTSKSTNKVICKDGTAMYRVLMYDSFGDGWDNTNLTVRTKDTTMNNNNNDIIVFNDQLQYGAYDVKYLCLNPLQPTCYDVTLVGGSWGKEISWEIRGLNAGSPSIAYGGSPMKCTFGTAGISTSQCPLTCLGMDDDEKQHRTNH